MDRHYRTLVIFWFLAHITHWGIFVGNIVASCFIIFNCPWYIVLPMLVIISNPIIGGLYCLFNNIENKYRHLLGWRIIERNFIETILEELGEYSKTRDGKKVWPTGRK